MASSGLCRITSTCRTWESRLSLSDKRLHSIEAARSEERGEGTYLCRMKKLVHVVVVIVVIVAPFSNARLGGGGGAGKMRLRCRGSGPKCSDGSHWRKGEYLSASKYAEGRGVEEGEKTNGHTTGRNPAKFQTAPRTLTAYSQSLPNPEYLCLVAGGNELGS